MENNKNKKKKTSKKTSIYKILCVLCLTVGAISLFTSFSISRSAVDLNKKIISISPPEETIVLKEETLKKTENIKEEKSTENIEKAENTEMYTEAEEVFNKNDNIQLSFVVPCDGEIIKIFSDTKPLKSKTMGDFRTHNGIDIKSALGEKVFAVENGIVENIYTDTLLGITIVISHNETLKTVYSNMAGADMVKMGEEVKKGQCIGCVGDTARGEKLDEAHLHFGVISDNKYINPADFLN